MKSRDKSSKALSRELEGRIIELEKKCQYWRRMFEMNVRKDRSSNAARNFSHHPQATDTEVSRTQTELQEEEHAIQEAQISDPEGTQKLDEDRSSE